jgi:hypothetical protein
MSSGEQRRQSPVSGQETSETTIEAVTSLPSASKAKAAQLLVEVPEGQGEKAVGEGELYLTKTCTGGEEEGWGQG